MSQDLASFVAILPAISCTLALAVIISERMNGSTELLDRICAIIDLLAPEGEEEPEQRIR